MTRKETRSLKRITATATETQFELETEETKEQFLIRT